MMQKLLIEFVIKLMGEVGKATAEFVAKYVAEKKLDKAITERVREIDNEKDPRVRAQRMRDLINSF
jgi:hypothetical protein